MYVLCPDRFLLLSGYHTLHDNLCRVFFYREFRGKVRTMNTEKKSINEEEANALKLMFIAGEMEDDDGWV